MKPSILTGRGLCNCSFFILQLLTVTPYAEKDIYLAGQLTDYELNDKTKMVFNAETGMYEAQPF